MTRNQVLEMIKSIGQEITYQNSQHIEIENIMYGEDIWFKFDESGNLIAIGC